MIGLDAKLDRLLLAAYFEDVASRDLTALLVPVDQIAKADVIFNEGAVLCGLPVIERLFRLIDEDLRFLPAAKDGEWMEPGRAIFYVEGRARTLLTVERTALNFLSHMSAIATKTRAFVDKVKDTKAKILDTRKTTPLMRTIDRYAVKTGGGENHRFGLFDAVLIKDNHLAVLRNEGIGPLLARARSRYPRNIAIGIEVQNLAEFEEALQGHPEYILLDNFKVDDVRAAVTRRNALQSPVPLEVSGGITLDNVERYALCGVERISIGALTHSIKAVDLSLNLI